MFRYRHCLGGECVQRQCRRVVIGQSRMMMDCGRASRFQFRHRNLDFEMPPKIEILVFLKNKKFYV
jgi:hypothetical protein